MFLLFCYYDENVAMPCDYEIFLCEWSHNSSTSDKGFESLLEYDVFLKWVSLYVNNISILFMLLSFVIIWDVAAYGMISWCKLRIEID